MENGNVLWDATLYKGLWLLGKLPQDLFLCFVNLKRIQPEYNKCKINIFFVTVAKIIYEISDKVRESKYFRLYILFK